MPKVSVIVPIYKVEDYVERCVRSLFMQTLDDIEYLFIDDATPDKSIEKLEEVMKLFPDRKSQCRLIRLSENKGIAYVRHLGIIEATGDFIIHCDSDDWIDRNMLEDLYNEAINSHSDIVVCDFYQVSRSHKVYIKAFNSISKDKYIYDCLLGKSYWSMCNKLVKRDLYKYIEVYPIANMGEDLVITIQLLYFSKKVSYINKSYYYYCMNELSIVNNPMPESVVNRFNSAKDNVLLLERFCNNKFKGLKYMYAVDSLKLKQLNLLNHSGSSFMNYSIVKQIYPELLYRLLINPYISFKDKVKFYLRVLSIYKR